MRFLREAIDAVQENLSSLALYLAITVSGGCLQMGYTAIVWHFDLDTTHERAVETGALLAALILVAVWAFAKALAFSRMGRELDKPLWKVKGDWEAVRRFFGLWFLLDLVCLSSVYCTGRLMAMEQGGGAAALYFVYFLLSVVSLPIGACIMFAGRADLRRMGEILAPLARELPRTLVVLLFSAAQFLLIDGLGNEAYDRGAAPVFLVTTFAVLNVIGGYCECVVFAGTWLLCKADRDTVREDDFDF